MVIPAGKFKATCLQLMDRVKHTGEEIVITKHGQPVARLVPVDKPATPHSTFGLLSDQTAIYGDIIASTGKRWDADE
jgi:prevent-host-death family protein